MSAEVSAARLRLAERCLIGAAAARPEIMKDENWTLAMEAVREMLKDCGPYEVGDGYKTGDGYRVRGPKPAWRRAKVNRKKLK